MENFDQLFVVIAENGKIGFNLNILETGLLNNIILIVIVFFAGKQLLDPSLIERDNTIKTSIEDAQNRLKEAKKRFLESEKQLNQAQLTISQIRIDTLTTKKMMLESDIKEAKNDLKIRFEKALATFKSKERQIFVEIKQQIISLVLAETVSRVKKVFEKRKNGLAMIDEIIKQMKPENSL